MSTVYSMGMLKKKDGPMAGVFVRFEKAQLKAIKRRAKTTKISEASIIRKAVGDYFLSL